MASDHTGRFRLFDRPLDRDAAVIGLFVSLALVPLWGLTSQIFVRGIPVILASACTVYLVGRWTDGEATRAVSAVRRHDVGWPRLPRWAAQSLAGFVFLVLSGMVVLAAFQGGRTTTFYDLSGVVGALILAQVLLVDDDDLHPPLLLAQLLTAALVIRYAALLTTPGFIGRDIWTHMELVEALNQERRLGAIVQSKYFAAPVFHLVVVATAGLLDVSPRLALFATIGAIVVPLGLLAYAVVGRFVATRWALLGTGLFLFSDEVVRWGIHLIPTSLGLLFFAALVYLVVVLQREPARWRHYGLFVFLSLAVVLTHQISSFILLLFLGCAVVAQLVAPLWEPSGPDFDVGARRTPLAPLFLFDLGLTLVVWSVTPLRNRTFLLGMVGILGDTLTSAGFLNLASDQQVSVPAAQQSSGWVLPLAENLGFFLLLFATFLGCLVVCRREDRSALNLANLLATATMLVFMFLLPLFGIQSFVPTRWYAFAAVPMVVLAVQGLSDIAERLPTRPAVALVLLLCLSYPGAMLIASDATLENPVFPDQQERNALTDSELAALRTMQAEYPDSQPIFTDVPYVDFFQRTGHTNADAAAVRPSGSPREPTFLYRTYQSTAAPYFRAVNDGPLYVNRIPRERYCGADRNIVYANDNVAFCTAENVDG